MYLIRLARNKKQRSYSKDETWVSSPHTVRQKCLISGAVGPYFGPKARKRGSYSSFVSVKPEIYEEPLRQPLTPPIVKLSSNSLRGVGNIRVFDVETLSSDTELCANNDFFSTGVRSVVNGIEFTATFATVKMAANFPAIFALVIHRLRWQLRGKKRPSRLTLLVTLGFSKCFIWTISREADVWYLGIWQGWIPNTHLSAYGARLKAFAGNILFSHQLMTVPIYLFELAVLRKYRGAAIERGQVKSQAGDIFDLMFGCCLYTRASKLSHDLCSFWVVVVGFVHFALRSVYVVLWLSMPQLKLLDIAYHMHSYLFC